jgi:pimeloyl-ACP methyl ester carboxylesterase
MLAALHPDLPRAIVVGDSPLSVNNRATEEPLHRAQNELWQRIVGQPEADIAAALKDMVIPVPGAEPRPMREVIGEDNGWFAHQATCLHQLDPTMLTTVLAGPEVMLEGYEPEQLLPRITCPVLLLQADPAMGQAMTDDDVDLALRLLPHATHVRMTDMGHPLHGPPGGTVAVLEAIAPFLAGLERLDSLAR